MTGTVPPLYDLMDAALKSARTHGAEQADIMVVRNSNRSALIRHGAVETVKQAGGYGFGLRVFIDRRMALVSGNDLSASSVSRLAEQACAMAQVLPQSPCDGLAEQPVAVPDSALAGMLELNDPRPLPETALLIALAREMEEAALHPPGITNSNGASASAGYSEIYLGTSTGFRGHYKTSRYGLGVSVLARQGNAMERDYATASSVFAEDLPVPALLGQQAAGRALARLNPVRPATRTCPVIIDRRVAGSILGHFAASINGSAIVRKASFLKDRMGQPVFAPHIYISDDPIRKRGLASRPFDAEACAGPTLALIKDGVLQHWLLDSRCGRELGLPSNGRAIRPVGSAPAPGTSNLFLHAGQHTPEELMADISEGVFVTELMGNAVNLLTGDYSRGASGFMIRNGQKAEPVSGLTIAGNLIDIFSGLEPANDLLFENNINAPTLRINHLMIAGR